MIYLCVSINTFLLLGIIIQHSLGRKQIISYRTTIVHLRKFVVYRHISFKLSPTFKHFNFEFLHKLKIIFNRHMNSVQLTAKVVTLIKLKAWNEIQLGKYLVIRNRDARIPLIKTKQRCGFVILLARHSIGKCCQAFICNTLLHHNNAFIMPLTFKNVW